jgi:EpsI family protein
MMKGSLRFGLVLVAILLAGIFINCWVYLGEAHVVRKELKECPQQLGGWTQIGGDQILDSQTLTVLRASDYVMRNYRTVDGQVANFYVGYYATQRDGATYHSPLNCLPGAGWTMSDPGQVTITSPNGRTFVANRYLIQNGDQKSVMVYWYQGRGRTVSSEYWSKVYTVWDSIRLRRSDGAMVRVTVPVGASESTALRSATDLAASATGVLPQFVPD